MKEPSKHKMFTARYSTYQRHLLPLFKSLTYPFDSHHIPLLTAAPILTQRCNSHNTLREHSKTSKHARSSETQKKKKTPLVLPLRQERSFDKVHSPAQQKRRSNSAPACSRRLDLVPSRSRPSQGIVQRHTPDSASASPTVPAELPHGFRSVAHHPDRSAPRQSHLLLLPSTKSARLATVDRLAYFHILVVQLIPLLLLDAFTHGSAAACQSSSTSKGPRLLSPTFVVSMKDKIR